MHGYLAMTRTEFRLFRREPYRRVTGVQRFLATAGREPTAACVHTVSDIFVLLRTRRPVPAAIKNERGR